MCLKRNAVTYTQHPSRVVLVILEAPDADMATVVMQRVPQRNRIQPLIDHSRITAPQVQGSVCIRRALFNIGGGAPSIRLYARYSFVASGLRGSTDETHFTQSAQSSLRSFVTHAIRACAKLSFPSAQKQPPKGDDYDDRKSGCETNSQTDDFRNGEAFTSS